MAKKIKLEKEMVSRLAGIGVNASDEATAKEQVLEILEQNGIDGMDDESLDTLIEIAESFVDPDEVDPDEEETETDEEETETDEEDEEETETDEEDEEETETDEEETETDEEETDEEETDEEETDEEETDEEETETDEEETKKPVKKQTKKVTEVKKPAKVETKKPAKKVATVKKSPMLDPKKVVADRKVFAFFDKVFPEAEYERAWIAAGVNYKRIGKNGKTGVCVVERCTVLDNGDVKCTGYLSKKAIPILDENGIEYELAWSGQPIFKNTTFSKMLKLIKLVLGNVENEIKKQDKKLGDNRKKMEEKMKEQAKPAVKKAAEVQKPANVKKVVVKKSAKK